MSEQEYFKNALANFMYEAASGDAICHLADQGYTVRQMKEQLAFPTSYEKIQKTVWKHLCSTGVLLLTEPGSGKQQEKITYVKDYDKYGKTSFRRVVLPANGTEAVHWKEWQFSENEHGTLAAYLIKKCSENGEDTAYISCDFGLLSRKDPVLFEKAMRILEEHQRDYILGIPWEKKIVYHRLNQQMRDIVIRLYENGEFHGSCYFIKIGEKVLIVT